MVLAAGKANNAMHHLSAMHNPHDRAPGLHLMQRTNAPLVGAASAAKLLALREVSGAGSPSASFSRSRCFARAGGYHPRGHDCSDPLGRAARAAVYLLPYGPGRRPTGGFRRDSCRAKTAGHPWPTPCGLFPVARLASATGPEGDTRRLFRVLRFVGSSAPLAIRQATVSFAYVMHRASCIVRQAAGGSE
ncbi:hypothetical protein C8J98_101179 [Luteibacter sp. OK325]|nr:hypothetical protein C8J98_101179 [Luteibacter sp. OK325]